MEPTKVSTYTDCQKRAYQKYYQANKDTLMSKMVVRNRKYYAEKKDTEEWKRKKQEYNRRFYQKTKERLASLSSTPTETDASTDASDASA